MSEEPTPRKRRQPAQRSSRPCDSCRRRKTRCIIEAGSQKCSICIQRQSECTFVKEVPKRSFPTPPETNQVSPNIHLSPAAHELLEPEQYPGQVRGTTATSDGIDPHYQAGLHHQIESSRTGLEGSLGLNTFKFAELYGLGSDMEPILMRHRPYDATSNEYSLPTHSIRLVSYQDQGVDYPVTFHMVANDKSVNYTPDFAEVDAIEACVRPHGEKLIRLFWQMVHPWYPVIYKHGFMLKYAKSYRCIDPPLLGAMYLNAVNWWYYDSHLSNQTIIDVANLHRMTHKSIQNSYHRPRLSSIEAILLCLQCKPEDPLNPDHSFSWGLTAQALSIGEALGLHLDASNWAIPSWEQSLRKRLSWALYMQDIWTALAHGRPTHISEDDWAVTDLTYNDFDTDNPRDAGEHYLHMTTLTKILYTVMKQFYTLKSTTMQNTEELFAMARPILTALESWYTALPSSLNIENLPPRQLCGHGNVHLAYHIVRVTILRRLVRSTALAPLCLDIPVLSFIRQQAHETAQQATSLVASLRLEHLDAFWYFASPYCFSVIGSFCTLLLVTGLTPAERDHWRETLRTYLWTLRVGSKSNEPMRYAVNRLEGAILSGLEHALAVAVDATSPITLEATPGQFQADMNGFGFAFLGADGVDLNTMDLGAFDLLANTGPT